MIPVLGDIHGNWNRINRMINKGDSDALCVGDLSNYHFEPVRGQRLFFTHGNHESFGYIEQLHQNPESGLHPIFAGDVYEVAGLRIAGLPGVYSRSLFSVPKTSIKFYHQRDIDAVSSLGHIDILLSHEAPDGIGLEKDGKQFGRTHVREAIERLRPRIMFCGHHHQYMEAEIGSTRVISLDLPKRSYVLLNPETLEINKKVSVLVEGEYVYG